MRFSVQLGVAGIAIGIACAPWSRVAVAQSGSPETKEINRAAQAQPNPPPASEGPADQAENIAKALFATGKAEYEAGQYDRALQHFQAAYLESKRPQLLYNVGLAADRLRYNRTAFEAFERYLQELPDAENRVEVQNRVRALHEVIDREAAVGKTVVGVSGTGVDAHVSGQPTQTSRRDANGLVTKWWFWTAVGVVAAGVVTAVAVASSGDKVSKPTPGSDGVVVLTLTKR